MFLLYVQKFSFPFVFISLRTWRISLTSRGWPKDWSMFTHTTIQLQICTHQGQKLVATSVSELSSVQTAPRTLLRVQREGRATRRILLCMNCNYFLFLSGSTPVGHTGSLLWCARWARFNQKCLPTWERKTALSAREGYSRVLAWTHKALSIPTSDIAFSCLKNKLVFCAQLVQLLPFLPCGLIENDIES